MGYPIHKFIHPLDNSDYVPSKMDSDSGDDNPMNNKPLVDKSKEIKGKKKNFGGKGGN